MRTVNHKDVSMQLDADNVVRTVTVCGQTFTVCLPTSDMPDDVVAWAEYLVDELVDNGSLTYTDDWGLQTAEQFRQSVLESIAQREHNEAYRIGWRD